jgi:hypothetical protein
MSESSISAGYPVDEDLDIGSHIPSMENLLAVWNQ